jgi:hypothetical protein
VRGAATAALIGGPTSESIPGAVLDRQPPSGATARNPRTTARHVRLEAPRLPLMR